MHPQIPKPGWCLTSAPCWDMEGSGDAGGFWGLYPTPIGHRPGGLGWHLSVVPSSIAGGPLGRIYGHRVPRMGLSQWEALGERVGLPCPPFLQVNSQSWCYGAGSGSFPAPVGWEWDIWPSLGHSVDKWEHLVAPPWTRDTVGKAFNGSTEEMVGEFWRRQPENSRRFGLWNGRTRSVGRALDVVVVAVLGKVGILHVFP